MPLWEQPVIMNRPSPLLYTKAVSSATKSSKSFVPSFNVPKDFRGSKVLEEGISPRKVIWSLIFIGLLDKVSSKFSLKQDSDKGEPMESSPHLLSLNASGWATIRTAVFISPDQYCNPRVWSLCPWDKAITETCARSIPNAFALRM